MACAALGLPSLDHAAPPFLPPALSPLSWSAASSSGRWWRRSAPPPLSARAWHPLSARSWRPTSRSLCGSAYGACTRRRRAWREAGGLCSAGGGAALGGACARSRRGWCALTALCAASACLYPVCVSRPRVCAARRGLACGASSSQRGARMRAADLGGHVHAWQVLVPASQQLIQEHTQKCSFRPGTRGVRRRGDNTWTCIADRMTCHWPLTPARLPPCRAAWRLPAPRNILTLLHTCSP